MSEPSHAALMRVVKDFTEVWGAEMQRRGVMAARAINAAFGPKEPEHDETPATPNEG